jgi:hypothetical protein
VLIRILVSGSRISFSRSNLNTRRQTAELHTYLSIAAVTLIVRRIVSEAVFCPDLGSDASECRTRIAEISGREYFAARSLRNRVHLEVRDLVKLLAYRESFKVAEVTEVACLLDVRF